MTTLFFMHILEVLFASGVSIQHFYFYARSQNSHKNTNVAIDEALRRKSREENNQILTAKARVHAGRSNNTKTSDTTVPPTCFLLAHKSEAHEITGHRINAALKSGQKYRNREVSAIQRHCDVVIITREAYPWPKVTEDTGMKAPPTGDFQIEVVIVHVNWSALFSFSKVEKPSCWECKRPPPSFPLRWTVFSPAEFLLLTPTLAETAAQRKW